MALMRWSPLEKLGHVMGPSESKCDNSFFLEILNSNLSAPWPFFGLLPDHSPYRDVFIVCVQFPQCLIIFRIVKLNFMDSDNPAIKLPTVSVTIMTRCRSQCPAWIYKRPHSWQVSIFWLLKSFNKQIFAVCLPDNGENFQIIADSNDFYQRFILLVPPRFLFYHNDTLL